jgi:hypothetical protein
MCVLQGREYGYLQDKLLLTILIISYNNIIMYIISNPKLYIIYYTLIPIIVKRRMNHYNPLKRLKKKLS